MKKTPQHIRDGDLLPDWFPCNATRVEIYGTKGMMLVGRHGGGWQIYDAEGQKDLFEYGHHTRMQMAHVENFVNCIRSREQPNADIEEGHVSSALCHMANIAYRVGNKHLLLDADKERFTNSEEANQLFQVPFREYLADELLVELQLHLLRGCDDRVDVELWLPQLTANWL